MLRKLYELVVVASRPRRPGPSPKIRTMTGRRRYTSGRREGRKPGRRPADGTHRLGNVVRNSRQRTVSGKNYGGNLVVRGSKGR